MDIFGCLNGKFRFQSELLPRGQWLFIEQKIVYTVPLSEKNVQLAAITISSVRVSTHRRRYDGNLEYNVKNSSQYVHASKVVLRNKDVSRLSAGKGMSGGLGPLLKKND